MILTQAVSELEKKPSISTRYQSSVDQEMTNDLFLYNSSSRLTRTIKGNTESF